MLPHSATENKYFIILDLTRSPTLRKYLIEMTLISSLLFYPSLAVSWKDYTKVLSWEKLHKVGGLGELLVHWAK